MATEINIQDFEGMFDLTSSKDNEDQAEEYGHSTGSEESFQELVEEIKEDLGQVPDDNNEDPHAIVKEVCSVRDKENDVVEIDEVNELTVLDEGSGDVLDNFVPPSVDNLVNEIVESNVQDEKPMLIDDKVQWFLTSSAPMYNGFYEHKRKLFNHLPGGQIEYTRWMNELADGKVDMASEVFDPTIIIEYMEEVQQYRERVKYIGVRVNNQFYQFKRFTELLRGTLARAQYLKPTLRQEGLVLEHMGDIELYLTRLEGLHNSILSAEKNFASAYDTFSRKVTICMELPPAERIDRRKKRVSSNATYSPASKEEDKEIVDNLDDFDDLPEKASSTPKHLKTGQIEWGEI